MGIIGTAFTVLTFLGVYVPLLGPFLISIGIPGGMIVVLMIAMTLLIILGFGVYLDRTVKFWAAQAHVATVRNPYLVTTLYRKESMNIRYNQLPQLKTFLLQIEAMEQTERATRLAQEVRESISKLEDVLTKGEWPPEPGEIIQ